MTTGKEGYRLEPIPISRRFAMDAGYMGRRAHITHGLLELDVTEPRRIIRDYEAQTGEKLSFTAFIINCLAEAIQDNPHLHAYRDWRNRLVIFDDVHITAMVEIMVDGRNVPMPHIFHAVNRRGFREIHDELRRTQAMPARTREVQLSRRLLRLPAFVRRLFYRLVLRVPAPFRQYSSPVMVTAVGMFLPGGGWAITMPSNTLTVALGSIVEKPGVVDGRIEIREYLDMTISINHDIVDGAPAARFAQRLKALIESGFEL